MHDRIYLKRQIALATLISGAVVAGCGGGATSTTAATVAAAATPASATTSASHTRTSRSADYGSGPLAFSKCMRANGVPNFPDPSAGGGFHVTGVDPRSPAFEAAQTACRKYMAPLRGSGGPKAYEQTLLKLRRIAVCMRAHGISEFPDPASTAPTVSPNSGVGVITDYDGAFLAFPSTLNMEAPAYRRALTACGAPPLGLPH